VSEVKIRRDPDAIEAYRSVLRSSGLGIASEVDSWPDEKVADTVEVLTRQFVEMGAVVRRIVGQMGEAFAERGRRLEPLMQEVERLKQQEEG
jgi:hypothetical protein